MKNNPIQQSRSTKHIAPSADRVKQVRIALLNSLRAIKFVFARIETMWLYHVSLFLISEYVVSIHL